MGVYRRYADSRAEAKWDQSTAREQLQLSRMLEWGQGDDIPRGSRGHCTVCSIDKRDANVQGQEVKETITRARRGSQVSQ